MNIANEIAELRADVRNLTTMVAYLVDALAAEQMDEAPITDLDGNVIAVSAGNIETLDDA